MFIDDKEIKILNYKIARKKIHLPIMFMPLVRALM